MNTPKKKKRFTREQLRDVIFAVHDNASKRDTVKEVGRQPVYQSKASEQAVKKTGVQKPAKTTRTKRA